MDIVIRQEAETRKTDTENMLDLADATYIDELDSVEALEEVESLLRDTLIGRDGSIPSQTTIRHYRRCLFFSGYPCGRKLRWVSFGGSEE